MDEIQTQDSVWYTLKFKEPKDDYSLRKFQTKPIKARQWINALLKRNEILFFYEEDGVEKHILGTLQGVSDQELLDAPLEVVTYGIYTYVQCYTIRAVECPTRKPFNIPVKNIKKFFLRNDNLLEVSKSLTWVDKE